MLLQQLFDLTFSFQLTLIELTGFALAQNLQLFFQRMLFAAGEGLVEWHDERNIL